MNESRSDAKARSDPFLDQRLAQGLRLQQARNWTGAEKAYFDVLAQAPEHADALSMLALLRHQQGDTPAAVALAGRAVAARPDSPELQMNLGNLLKAQGAWEPAIECYRAALRLRPGFADASNNLGNALLEIGRPEEALTYYERARTANPSDALVHCNMGAALRRLGRYDGAVASLRVAAALSPANSLVHTNLGNALRDAGDLAGSIAAYEAALRLDPIRTEAIAGLLRRHQVNCNWHHAAELERQMMAQQHLASGRFNLFNFLSLTATPAQQFVAARGYTRRVSRGIRPLALPTRRV